MPLARPRGLAAIGVLMVLVAQRADAQVCRARNSSGGMRIGVEQLTASGDDAGKTINIGIGVPKGPVFELGLASEPKSDEIGAFYGIAGWELRPQGSAFSACPFYGLMNHNDAITHSAGLQAGYEMKLSNAVSLTPGGSIWYNFGENGDPYASYWAGASLNFSRFSVYASLENALDSSDDPKVRIGLSLNVGGAFDKKPNAPFAATPTAVQRRP